MKFGWRFPLWSQVLIAAWLVSAAHAQPPRRLWVLRAPDEIVEYDVATFAPLHTLRVPRRLIEHPEYLRINAKGQMLFVPPKGTLWTNGEMAPEGDRSWFWDGHHAKKWNFEGHKTRGGTADKRMLTETALQWFLSAEGESLFRLENRFEKVLGKSGLERAVRATARFQRTDLVGSQPETVVSLSSSGWCQCGTGLCSETCPEWSAWAPNGVVGDFFVLTRITPGQLGPTYHESRLYERSGRRWEARKLSQPIEMPLVASANGDVLVAAVPDAGCCGWENESSDRLLLLRNGKVTVLYEEYARYNNRDYDVSFYVRDAGLASDNERLAYTLVSTARADTKLRLSSDGKVNAGELARVRKTIAELPAVEIMQLGNPSRPATVIPHAALVGWLSERKILLAQDGRLVVYDSLGGKRREMAIRVRSAADAFLR